MKGNILIVLCLIGVVYGTSASQLYSALNISCYGEDEMKKICDSTTTAMESPTKVRHLLSLTQCVRDSLTCYS